MAVRGIVAIMSILTLTSTSFWYGANGDPFSSRHALRVSDNSGWVSSQWDNWDTNDEDETNNEDGRQSSRHKNDQTAPTISAFSVATTATATTIRTTMDESGQGYFVVLPSGAPAPTAKQVRWGQDASGGANLLADNGPGASGDDEFPIYNLASGTTYVVYFTMADRAENLSDIKSATFTTVSAGGGGTGTGSTGTWTTGSWSTGTGSTGTGTTGTGTTWSGTTGSGDTTPPVISLLSIGGITSSDATLSATLSENGTGYFVVLPNGASVPTSLQVQSGQDASGAIVSIKGSSETITGSTQFVLTGLSATTTYALYLVATDTTGNLITTPMSINFTTLATGGGGNGTGSTTPPTITALSVSGTTSSGTILTATVAESGTGYFVVLPNNSAVPTAAQIKLGQDAFNAAAFMSGSSATGTWTNEFSVTGLESSTIYLIYFTAADASGNLQPVLRALGVMTAP